MKKQTTVMTATLYCNCTCCAKKWECWDKSVYSDIADGIHKPLPKKSVCIGFSPWWKK